MQFMKHRISKSFIIQIGFWNDKDDLQYPYAMIGIQRGLHIIKNEQEFTAWKAMEVDDSYKAFNTKEFNCKGKWIDVCKKTYDDQMSYYLDPKNAPVANQAFADGFRMGMDYMVP
jgi:hypothetical protein